MSNQPTQSQLVKVGGEPLFTRVLNDLRQHRPQLAESESLQILRFWSVFGIMRKQTALVTKQVTLSAAKGEDIERLALLDPITELYNHRAFVKELKAELARAKRYKHPASLVLLSVDGYDELAGQYGSVNC
jgi:PleD family two-component response regulator